MMSRQKRNPESPRPTILHTPQAVLPLVYEAMCWRLVARMEHEEAQVRAQVASGELRAYQIEVQLLQMQHTLLAQAKADLAAFAASELEASDPVAIRLLPDLPSIQVPPISIPETADKSAVHLPAGRRLAATELITIVTERRRVHLSSGPRGRRRKV